MCQQQALARCLLVPGLPYTWLAVLATASLFAFVVFPLIAGVLSPSHSPSSPSFPQTRRHELPAMSGSQLGAATSTHCRRDEETGNTIPINPGKAGKEPVLVGPYRGLKRQSLQCLSFRGNPAEGLLLPHFDYVFVSRGEIPKAK